MSNSIFNKVEGEGILEYILRLADEKQKDKSITWQLIADCVESQFGLVRSEGWVRRTVKDALGLNSYEEDILDQINEQKKLMDETYLNIRKEKVRLSDERVQANYYYRALSREETIKEIALQTAQEMSNKKILPKYQEHLIVDCDNDCREAILCVSDWHYGIEIKNMWNEFNPEICKIRVAKLLGETIQKVKLNKCKKIYLVNLGDLIAGRIHLGLRLDSRFDVVTQVMQVSEILAEFISSLTKYVKVEYFDCLDNHSRLEPNKKDAQELETLARITPWYLKERLKDNSNFNIVENVYSYDMSTFSVLGHNVIGVHGDKDKPASVIERLQAYTRTQYELVLMAHRHHMSMDESSGTLLLCNGSLMGTDSYAQQLRLYSPPSQNLIIVSRSNPMECVYRIPLQ